MPSWFRYDVFKVRIRKLFCRLLYNLWKEAVGDKPNWNLISYPGLVHVFIPGEKSEGAAVYMKEEHIDSQVISDIAEFVHGEGK